jgi:2-oxoglutarate ferredoxin oxidoreductase subunit alpha
MIVLAPSSVQELFDYTIEAFNLAEKYRNPVVVILEMTLSLMRERMKIRDPSEIKLVNRKHPKVPPEKFIPFEGEEDGVPPMSKFGEGYNVLYTINPHNKYGMITGDLDIYDELYKRITSKITRALDDIVKYQKYHMDDANIAVIAYGSESRSALEAVRKARKEGIKAGLLKLITVWPFHDRLIRNIAEQVDKIIVPEMNLGRYVNEIKRASECLAEVRSLPLNSGRMHTSEEILEGIKR